jgi:hypothetical protein
MTGDDVNETDLAGYQIHPVAAIFPVLADDELQELADDIRANGLHQPIVRDAAGVIIDGRNRLLACLRSGVEPRFTALPAGADPVAYILSANVQRRHLNKGQIAMAIAKGRTFSSVKFQGKGEAATSAGLSGAMLSKAIAVLEHASGLVDAVLADEASLNDAYTVARWHKMEAEIKRGTKRDPETNRVVITIPTTLEEAEAKITKIFEEQEALRHYLGAYRRIYRVADDSKLGQKIAALERRLAEFLDGDEARSA